MKWTGKPYVDGEPSETLSSPPRASPLATRETGGRKPLECRSRPHLPGALGAMVARGVVAKTRPRGTTPRVVDPRRGGGGDDERDPMTWTPASLSRARALVLAPWAAYYNQYTWARDMRAVGG